MSDVFCISDGCHRKVIKGRSRCRLCTIKERVRVHDKRREESGR